MKRPPRPKLIPPIKYHGGKHYLAKYIISLMTKHRHYVEPFFGGGAVLLAKNPEGVSEVVNDKNAWLTNFWRVLQHSGNFEQFRRMAEATPVSQGVWENAVATMEAEPDVRRHDPVVAATMFFIRCRQSLAGRMDSFTPLSRTRTRRGMNEQASAWLTAIEGLPAVHERLKRVVILTAPAVDVIKSQDGPNTQHYLDPTYPHDTRSSKDTYGEFEMSNEDHARLLATIKACTGKVMISSYDNDLYRRELADWTRHTVNVPNNAAGGAKKARMTEVLWCNF